MSNDKMREAFEADYSQNWLGGGDLFKRNKLKRGPGGSYVDPETAAAWWGYQQSQQPEIEPDVWLFPDRVWSELSSVEIGRNGMGAFLCPHLSAQVPDKKELKDTPREYFQTDSELYVYTAGWNDCRDSMLAPSIVENKDG